MKLFLLLVLMSCSRVCVESTTVVKVGGCDKWGECGVIYANGTVSTEYYPVEGETVCVKSVWK